jgi:carbamoyl-phosphate synthase large subunit
VTPEYVESIIERERPDGILLGFGGQTALNCGIKLSAGGVLDRYGVRVLGTPIGGIEVTEDRGLFKDAMIEAGLSVPRSVAAYSMEEAEEFVNKIGYPVIMRVAYTLGGKGGGVARNETELRTIVEKGLNSSIAHQVLVEEYVGGWKQIEYEVMRDSDDNSIIVCNMENVLGMRVHTGDNVVVAPSQTLTNREYHLLRTASITAARRAGIIGECNVQYALDTASERFHVIEINARMSRSSALASKATGYPLAYIATKLALGYRLTELKNKVSGVTTALFEPSLDYVVVKMPRWDTVKFDGATRTIGTSMKSIGEVMAIGRVFEEALQKAMRMLDTRPYWSEELERPEARDKIIARLASPTDTIVVDAMKALLLGVSEADVSRLSEIDPWFVSKFNNIVKMRSALKQVEGKTLGDQPQLLTRAKRLGFSDSQIGYLTELSGDDVRALRKRIGVNPTTKVIDTLAAEWPAKTNYLYMTYDATEEEAKPTHREKVMILGAGPYRIGSSVEFDWGTMHMAWSLKRQGVEEVIVVNCNPETVSTDFDMSDRLYFEELSVERILEIYEKEKPKGIVLCVGGQTPNDLALKLHARGVRILGTTARSIELAEDRQKFSSLLDRLEIPQPEWGSFSNLKSAKAFCRSIGYPVVVRPSHVLSGSAMRVVWDEGQLATYLEKAMDLNPEYSVTVSRFYDDAREVEVDAVSDGEDCVIGAVIEHVQRAGVHSGDAIMSIPPFSISPTAEQTVRSFTRRIARGVGARGPLNIQFLVRGEEVLVIECNLRASRSLPYVSKATGVNLVELAARVVMGAKLSRQDDVETPHGYAVKAPQFSFMQIDGAEPRVGVEMRSTGEVACFGETFVQAMRDAFIATGHRIPKRGDSGILLSCSPNEAAKLGPLLDRFREAGLDVVHLQGLQTANQEARGLDRGSILKMLSAGRVSFVLAFSANSNQIEEEERAITKKAVELQVQVLTTPEEAEAFLQCAMV